VLRREGTHRIQAVPLDKEKSARATFVLCRLPAARVVSSSAKFDSPHRLASSGSLAECGWFTIDLS